MESSRGQQFQTLRHGRREQQRSTRKAFAGFRRYHPAITLGLHANDLRIDPDVQPMREVFRDRSHSVDAAETRFAIALERAVSQREPSRPCPHDPRRLPGLDPRTKLRIARGEKLRPMIERAQVGSPSGQPPSHAAPFVQNQHAAAGALQFAGRGQTRHSTADD